MTHNKSLILQQCFRPRSVLRKTCESITLGKLTKFAKGPLQNAQHWKSSESVTNGLLIRMQAEARNPQAKIRTRTTLSGEGVVSDAFGRLKSL